jgi:thiol-disulfide isomerase/thioredoxin
MKLALLIALFSFTGLAYSASVAELLQTVNESLDADDMDEAGSGKRAQAIADLIDEDLGLTPADHLDLRLALADAWVGAGNSDEAEKALSGVLKDPAVSDEQRDRAGLTWVASWQKRVRLAEKPADVPLPTEQMTVLGATSPKVKARVLSADAERFLALKLPNEAIDAFDKAIALLKSAPPAERVPLYSMRLLAMEQAGGKPEDIQAWLKKQSSDPAIAQVIASALTGGQRLIGQAAPPLTAPRLDGKPGDISLANLKGQIVLLDFFATWCKPCEVVAPAIAQFASAHDGRGIAVIGISLDTKDTNANIAAYAAKYGIAYPIIGDLLGWDSEIDDAFHVDGIPAVILIDQEGKIAAIDLIGQTPEETLVNLGAAIKSLQPTEDNPAEAMP